MTACSPASFTISVGDDEIPTTCQVRSVKVEKAINHISSATIVVLDGSASDETFQNSSSAIFVPGGVITIKAGYNNEEETLIFKGIISKQALRVEGSEGPTLEIHCKDQAVKMTIGRNNASFFDTTDSAVINQLIDHYDDLSATVTNTIPTLPILQQYYVTDWDFMLTRAEVNGLVVTTINSEVAVFSAVANTSSVLTVTYGDNLFSLNADLNSLTQFDKVEATAWDFKTQKLITAEVPNTLAEAGNLSSDTLSEVADLNVFRLQTTAALDQESLESWAKAQMLKSELSKITGDVKFQGSALVEPGNYITLAGVGSRFNGDQLVSKVSHDISEDDWLTVAELGLDAQWFAQEPDVMHPKASGQLPGTHGLYNATVKQMYDDPDSEYRILLDLPLFNPSGEGLWARLANFYSSGGAGAFFLPEVDDEVVVGFLNDDPRYPIILGSLYSTDIKPYETLNPAQGNPQKGIVSKSGLRLMFDDKDIITTVITPNGNELVLDDKNQQITLQDQNKNSIVMSSEGISIKSPNAINIQSDQTVQVQGETGVTVSAPGGDAQINATNIQQTADEAFSANGGMTATVEAGTDLTLNGAMVMIN